jgi:hypothetical protein
VNDLSIESNPSTLLCGKTYGQWQSACLLLQEHGLANLQNASERLTALYKQAMRSVSGALSTRELKGRGCGAGIYPPPPNRISGITQKAKERDIPHIN